MFHRTKTADTTSEIVELFADSFETNYDEDDQVWSFNGVFQQRNDAVDINLSLCDIAMAINALKWKSGAGPDGIKPFVIKMCNDSIV